MIPASEGQYSFFLTQNQVEPKQSLLTSAAQRPGYAQCRQPSHGWALGWEWWGDVEWRLSGHCE